ncbi:hypothetical protein DIURU_000242 [Diutina rugosa]|uniref:CoA-binding domain-containing protein n=1 Tax=Diutina rugosa TaxID=5481 RepID=A0A642UYW2_DIURU|nr:uncharacterized protein DIURU_000242 [Diutina rugosa]KAA8908273.1 hypothetical protein DIURU_000242 [Diutina rugosa]
MSMKTKIKSFFGPTRQYLVAGASNNPTKFGYKILNWYLAHDLNAIPINPREEVILDQKVVPSITEVLKALKQHQDLAGYPLSASDGVSISFLTPPKITVATLDEIAKVDGYRDLVRGLWFQPGSYNQEVVDKAESLGLYDIVVYEDECILVRGEEGMYSANL